MSIINFDLIQGINLGKRFLPKNKWNQWSNFVTVSYGQNYKKENVGLLLKYFKALNSNDSIRVIFNMFSDDFRSLDDDSLKELLIYCARFHERGIYLLEYVAEIFKINLDPKFVQELKKKSFFDKDEEISEYDSALIDSELISVQFGDENFVLLRNENDRLCGLTEDNRLLLGYGEGNYIVLFLLDSSFYEIYVGNAAQSIKIADNKLIKSMGGMILRRLELSEIDVFIKNINIRRIYQYQDANILLAVMEELKGFTTDEPIEGFKGKVDKLFLFYEEDIVKLTKST